MPRIKPARTQEEINAVPQDKSVTIALEPEGVVILDKDQDELEQKQLTAKPEVKAEPEEDNSNLKQQLEDLRRANTESNRRVQEEITARQQAEQRVKERDQEVKHSKIRAEDAEYDAILNAIGAAESEADAAQRDIMLASEGSDPKGVAEASRKLARAESRLSQLEDGKLAIERAKTMDAQRAKEAPAQVERKQAPTVEEYINQLPNLVQSQRDWLRAHQDALTDTDQNMILQGAHAEAIKRKGLTVGTPKYFAYLEERLGYITPEEIVTEDDDNAAPVQAPPSRNATNPGTGRPSNTRITLTPEQREIARISGIDEITYARQLQKLQALKADGHYSN